MKTKPRTTPLPQETKSTKGIGIKERSRSGKGSKQVAKEKQESCNFSETQTSFPSSSDILPFDHEKLCPRFCALASRDPDDDPCTIDELDPLQLELEQMLLHNVLVQRRVDNASKGMDGRKTSVIKSEPMDCNEEPSTSGSSKELNGRSSPIRVKVEMEPDSSTGATSPGPPRPTALSPSARFARFGRRSIHFWPQNNMPDKFWQFVSAYCADIQQTDMNFVKELYQESSEEKFSHLFKLPGLGKHYSLRWNEDSNKSTPNSRNRSSNTNSKRKIKSTENSDSEEELGSPRSTKPPPKKLPVKSPRHNTATKSTANVIGVSGSNTRSGACDPPNLGSLTERLVQALMEENNSSDNGSNNNNEKHNDIDSKDAVDMNGMCSPNRALIKSLNLGNVAALERRIRKELKEQGLLDEEDETEESEDEEAGDVKQQDEVTEELMKRQGELKDLMASNRVRLLALEKKAQQKIHEQSLQHLLTKCDVEIDQLCSRFYNLVPKRKPCNKKERDLLQKALKDRLKVTQQLDVASLSD